MSTRSSTPIGSRISGALELNGQQFPFYLECRTLDLGPAGPVEYYYMPISRLRHSDATQEVSNFRSAIGFWNAAMQDVGGADDWVQQVNYVLAICYALVNRDKGAQRIYRDAQLRPRSFRPENLKLSADVCARIQRVVASRNRSEIQREMDVALEAAQLSEGDMIAASRAMDQWVNRGVFRLRTAGRDGLRTWLAEVDEWNERFRKRSNGRMRTFLDVFATECKLSFYLCYANFWIGLLRWLEENRNLDPMSKRFLSLWHNQNRPVEVVHGRTPSGIIYPTVARRVILSPETSGDFRLHEVTWKTNHVGPEVVPDVFRGQVLALHPLNWILLSRPELCEHVGGCIASSQFDEAMRTGHVEYFPEYWRLVESIVTAAHLYRHAHLENESKRSIRRATQQSSSPEGSAEPDISPEILLRDFVEAIHQCCPCGGTYHYSAAELPVAEGKTLSIPVVCERCELTSLITVERHEIESFLRPDPDA